MFQSYEKKLNLHPWRTRIMTARERHTAGKNVQMVNFVLKKLLLRIFV